MTFRTTLLAASFSLAAAGRHVRRLRPDHARQPVARLSRSRCPTCCRTATRSPAVVSGARGNSGPVDTIFVQRDQSAFKCIDPQLSDAKIKAVCFELVQAVRPRHLSSRNNFAFDRTRAAFIGVDQRTP